MNEAQVRTLDQVREVLAGTQELQLRPVADQTGRHAWIMQALKQFDYRCSKRMERGLVLTYLGRDRRLTHAATVEDIRECRDGFPILASKF